MISGPVWSGSHSSIPDSRSGFPTFIDNSGKGESIESWDGTDWRGCKQSLSDSGKVMHIEMFGESPFVFLESRTSSRRHWIWTRYVPFWTMIRPPACYDILGLSELYHHIYTKKWELRHHSFNTMWTFVIVFIAAIVQGELLQQLPVDFCNSTNVVWLGPDQFTLPWQFSRTPEGRLFTACNLL